MMLYVEKNKLQDVLMSCTRRSRAAFTYTRSEGDVEGVDACQSKVCDLDFSAAADQDVSWFQVAVQHHVCVQEVQTSQQLLHHVLRRQKAARQHLLFCLKRCV